MSALLCTLVRWRTHYFCIRFAPALRSFCSEPETAFLFMYRQRGGRIEFEDKLPRLPNIPTSFCLLNAQAAKSWPDHVQLSRGEMPEKYVAVAQKTGTKMEP